MDLSEHTSLAGLADAISAVLEVAARLDCEVYVAGALARDLWLEFGHGIDTGRETRDVDFGVECADWPTFEEIAAGLEELGIEHSRTRKERFTHGNGTIVDLIPFGGVERADRTIAWPPAGDRVMSLVGFAEVAASTAAFVLPGAVEVPVVTLPALAVLKLLAWEDRRTEPTVRDKDAEDLVTVATYYLDVREPPLDHALKAALLGRNDYEDKVAGAEQLAADMAAFGSQDVREVIERVIAREEDPDGPLALARVVSRYEALHGLPFVRALRRGFLG
jgi:predicted nucleotidyltransferase